jgi:uncharacterized membrane protein (Fun14 family)
MSYVAEINKMLESYNIVWKDLLFAFGIGFVVGFLLKILGRPFIYCVIAGGVLLFILQHYGLITIHEHAIRTLFGISGTISADQIMVVIKNFVLQNAVSVFAGCMAFIFGWKLAA